MSTRCVYFRAAIIGVGGGGQLVASRQAPPQPPPAGILPAPPNSARPLFPATAINVSCQIGLFFFEVPIIKTENKNSLEVKSFFSVRLEIQLNRKTLFLVFFKILFTLIYLSIGYSHLLKSFCF